MARTVVILAIALLSTGIATQSAEATADRFTRGDAEAVLNTYPTTDQILTGIEEETRGLDIRPFDVFADKPYCVEDWHVLAFAHWAGEFEATDPPITFTRADAWTFLGGVEATFTLDGAPVELGVTPTTQVHSAFALTTFEPELEAALGFDVTVGKLWGVQWGRIIPANELPVGEHTFSANVVSDDGIPLFTNSITFEVSGPDSTACTGA